MLDHLVKLAEYFNKQSMKNEESLVNSLIVEAQSTDLGSHPLGPMVIDYVRNAFMVSDEGSSEGLIQVKKINELVDAGLKTNADTLESYNNIDDNPNPIQLRQFQELFFPAIKLVKSEYKFKGKSDAESVRDWYTSIAELIDIVYKNYEESYMEEYMGAGSVAGDFPPSEPVGPISPLSTKPFTKAPTNDDSPTDEYGPTI